MFDDTIKGTYGTTRLNHEVQAAWSLSTPKAQIFCRVWWRRIIILLCYFGTAKYLKYVFFFLWPNGRVWFGRCLFWRCLVWQFDVEKHTPRRTGLNVNPNRDEQGHTQRKKTCGDGQCSSHLMFFQYYHTWFAWFWFHKIFPQSSYIVVPKFTCLKSRLFMIRLTF